MILGSKHDTGGNSGGAAGGVHGGGGACAGAHVARRAAAVPAPGTFPDSAKSPLRFSAVGPLPPSKYSYRCGGVVDYAMYAALCILYVNLDTYLCGFEFSFSGAFHVVDCKCCRNESFFAIAVLIRRFRLVLRWLIVVYHNSH